MTLSISDQPSHWHRVTKRHSLLNDATIDPFPYRDHRAASLLDHHIVRDAPQDARVADNGRRSTVPYLPHPVPPPIAAHPPPPPPDPRYPGSVVHPEHFHDTRKRSLQEMAAPDISECSSSPTSTGQMDGGNQFCLCQPEPKIPRPRNGKELSSSRVATSNNASQPSFFIASINKPRWFERTQAYPIRPYPRSLVNNGAASPRMPKMNGKRLRKYVKAGPQSSLY